jgi:hypothetical protein
VLGPDSVSTEITTQGLPTSRSSLKAVGIIGRAFNQILTTLLERRKAGATIHISANYYELYNEQIFDLLSPHSLESQSEEKELRPKLIALRKLE